MAPFGIRLDHCLVGELVVLPDQLVRAVVLVGDGGASPGDGGYVPVVVVGVFVGVVAAVLVCGQQGRLRAVGARVVGQRRRVPCPQVQRTGGQSAHAVIRVRQLFPAGEGHLMRTVVVVVGIDCRPGGP